jgi:hypothetical protein
MEPCPPIPPRPESGGFCSGFAPQNRRTHATPDSSLSLSLKTAPFRSLALMLRLRCSRLRVARLGLRCRATASLRAFHLRDTGSAAPRPGCDLSKKPAFAKAGYNALTGGLISLPTRHTAGTVWPEKRDSLPGQLARRAGLPHAATKLATSRANRAQWPATARLQCWPGKAPHSSRTDSARRRLPHTFRTSAQSRTTFSAHACL